MNSLILLCLRLFYEFFFADSISDRQRVVTEVNSSISIYGLRLYDKRETQFPIAPEQKQCIMSYKRINATNWEQKLISSEADCAKASGDRPARWTGKHDGRTRNKKMNVATLAGYYERGFGKGDKRFVGGLTENRAVKVAFRSIREIEENRCRRC